MSPRSVADRGAPLTAVDTSVVVAALLAWHEHHSRALPALRTLVSAGNLVVPVHVLVESFAVLTRLPRGQRVAPAAARSLLRTAFRKRAVFAPLRAESAWRLMDDADDAETAGGATYDLAILSAARDAGATRLLTLNERDFLRFPLPGVEIDAP